MVRFYFILLITTVVGCGGPDSTVQGTVTIDGQLAPRGTVVFHPVGGGPTAYGTIADNGSYSLRVGQGDLSDPDAGQISSGEYIVTVVVNMPSIPDEAIDEGGPPKPGARLTAGKYANKDTSDLRATVTAGRNIVPLELEGAGAEESQPPSPSTSGETEDEAPTEPVEDSAPPTNQAPSDSAESPPADAATPEPPQADPQPEEPESSAEEQAP